jgi:hypothetical protein
MALAADDRELLWKVYFGTPYAGFRQRIMRMAARPLELPASYDWQPFPGVAKGRLDVETGETSGAARLKAGSLAHRLLKCLADDFYRPARIGTLFPQLFPDEYFDPVRCQSRVHNAIAKLRRECKAKKIPLTISEDFEEYHLQPSRPFILTVTAGSGSSSGPVDAVENLLLLARREFGGRVFTSQELAARAKVSVDTVQRFLTRFVERQAVRREGKGRATKYKLTG